MTERQKASQSWTNEKHSHYLDAMEASFVRTMLEDTGARRPLRLDRHMPDSGDTTRDSMSQVRNKHPSSSSGRSKMDSHGHNRWKRHATSSSFSSAHDQVVPQMSYDSDKGGKDRSMV